MQNHEIVYWLKEQDPKKLKHLWEQADQARLVTVGEQIHLRGLIEISNYCARQCAYCGINASQTIKRYRMTKTEILACAVKAQQFGYGTVVMQAGEDYELNCNLIASIIEQIKKTTKLAVTLSLGERSFTDLKTWKNAGVDRYLLRFETSDKKLYNLIHPANQQDKKRDRIAILQELKELQYEVGSGAMIGIPGQTYTSLADDITLFSKLDLDMIGVGPYIPAPSTLLGSGKIKAKINPKSQVPNTELMTYKVIALARIMCPEANIPATTALATLNKTTGRELALMRGANVIMPNLTPSQYRSNYKIYPNKACLNETANQCNECLTGRITAIGRTIGKGPGNRIKNSKHD